jgi:hypothetical protein
VGQYESISNANFLPIACNLFWPFSNSTGNSQQP